MACNCECKDVYHPANKSLNVLRASTKAPATETRTVDTKTSKKKIIQKQAVTDARVYHRLLSTSKLLPDPASDVIYERTKTSQTASPRDGADATKLMPNCVIPLPSCCTRHRQEVHSVVIQHRKLLYNSPEPIFTTASYIKDRVEQLAERNHKLNSIRQYPLSTVCVRWRTPHMYTARTLDKIMSLFGPVERIHMSASCGTSAVVVFSNLGDSCKPVMMKSLGYPGNCLHCHWLHHGLQSRTFHGTQSSRLLARNNELVHPTQ